MYFYLLMHLAGCSITLPYYGYIALQWVGAARCNPLLFFVLLQLRFPYILVSTVPITLLAVDRCLVIRLAARWTDERRGWLVGVGCLLTAGLIAVNLAFIPFESPAKPSNPNEVCPAPATMEAHGNYKSTAKEVLEAVDIVVSVYLIYVMRKYQVRE